MLFEIGEKIGYAHFLRKLTAVLVDKFAVLMRTYCKGCGEVIAAQLFRCFSCFTQAIADTFSASFTSFGQIFKSLCQFIKWRRIVILADYLHIKPQFLNKSDKLLFAVYVLTFGSNIGIEKIQRYAEIIAEKQQSVAASG